MAESHTYASLARARIKDLPTRLAFGLIIGMAAFAFTREAGAFVWFGVMLAAQSSDTLVARWIARKREATPRADAVYFTSMLINSAVFSSVSAYTWFLGGPAGQVFGILIPAGALLNTALQMEQAPRAIVPLWLPHIVYLLGLPLVAAGVSPQPDLIEMGFVSFGGMVFVAHLVLAVRRFRTHLAEQQQSAARLLETQTALAAFVAAVPASVMVTDKAMRIVQASPAWLDAFGLTLEQARGRSIYDLRPEYFEPFRSAYERGLAGENVHGAKVRSPQPDGSLRYLRSEMTPWRDHSGEPCGLIVAALDVTEMVEAMERTERSQQRLKLAVELADLHVWECDYVRKTVETDGAGETFFDHQVEPHVFLQDTSITMDPRDRAEFAEDWRLAVLEDRPFRPEYRINRKDGREVWATCTAKLIRDQAGTPIRLVGAMQNITERKASEAALVGAKEEAEAANRAKSNFLATMSHEIRTPLNGVIGMAQAMAGEDLSPAQRERLSVIRQSGEALLAILNDVLDLSKIEAGKLELELDEFNLSSLVHGAHAAFTAIAERKGLDFVLTVQPQAQGRYNSDSARIRQILYNLISNALKFTEQGEVRVIVDWDATGLHFVVEDSGCGMPLDVTERLFNKFEQADATTTRRFGGTGLGLAICRDLAGLLGGTVSVHSQVGVGSQFRLHLPLERLGDEVSGSSAETGHETSESAAGLRVLAAEDNPINQLVLKTLLHQVGIEPVIVGNGAEAVDAWRTGEWDLILMDVQMPIMDGPSATRAIRAEERIGRRRPVPIIALTANAMSHQVEEYHGAGMTGFVAKPIDAAKLYEALQKAFADSISTEDAA